MNWIEELEKRLADIETVADGLRTEIKLLKQEKSELKPWRADIGKEYFTVSESLRVETKPEDNDYFDGLVFNCGNYYRTKELAEQDARELKERNRLRQLRDELCEGYKFVNERNNYYIYFSSGLSGYYVAGTICGRDAGKIYFDTQEHAQIAANWMNTHFKQEE